MIVTSRLFTFLRIAKSWNRFPVHIDILRNEGADEILRFQDTFNLEASDSASDS